MGRKGAIGSIVRRWIVAAVALGALVNGCGGSDDFGSATDGGARDAASVVPDVASDVAADVQGDAAPAGFRAVWASGNSDVWAVGAAGTVIHFDGQSWTPFASGTTENLTGLSGTGPGDVWATGDNGSVLHWDGAAWSIVNSQSGVALIAVWAT